VQASSLQLRTRLLVSFAVVGLLAGIGAGALYAYDSSRENRLANGVVIAGFDVGGMDARLARLDLGRALLPRLQRPLVVQYGLRRFVLRPEQADFSVAIAGAVNQALEKSREGGLFHRVYRELSGGSVPQKLVPQAAVSREAVAGWVERLAKRIHRPPVAARLVPSVTSLRIVPGRDGVALRTAALTNEIAKRMTSLSAPRALIALTRPVPPKVSAATLPRRYPFFITIDRSAKRLHLWEHLKLAKTYVIAVGRVGLETPAGLYRIEDKQVNPSWHVPLSSWAGSLAGQVIPPGPADPLKARWMGFYDGSGIHGTDDIGSLGSAASHGCIRMAIPDAIQLYDIVPLHTPIFIS
jgi:lipoprotein-anchoring transpeptidase ErfK/SrfK